MSGVMSTRFFLGRDPGVDEALQERLRDIKRLCDFAQDVAESGDHWNIVRLILEIKRAAREALELTGGSVQIDLGGEL